MEQRKLKLGLLLDSYELPAWLNLAMERIVRSQESEIVLVVLNAGESSGHKNLLIPRLYNIFDEKFFVRENNALQFINAKPLLGQTRTILIRPEEEGGRSFFKQEDVTGLRQEGLDILFRLGFDGIEGEIAGAARYGLWEYYSELEPHGVWEVMEGQTETRMSIRMRSTDTPAGQILFSAASLTYPFSPARNRNRSLWKAASYLPRQIHLLHFLGEAAFFQQAKKYHQILSIPSRKVPALPKQVGEAAKLLAKNAGEIITRKTTMDAWYLMFDCHGEDETPKQNYMKVIPPKELFWADPHVIQKDDQYFVFVEEYDSVTGKGRISVLTIQESGQYDQPVPVLDKEYHLSYPCVFEWQGRFFMVPESSANRTIDLYECTEFPLKWEHKLTLLDHVNAVDTTLIFHDGKWWLFTGISENEGSSPEVELFLYYSDTLFSDQWTPHPLNPLKSDAKNARPAGAIFEKDGKLFRPSQDCSQSYGYGFDLNEIVVLSENAYEEKCAVSVRPDWDKKVLATHTFGSAGNFKIIDAYTLKNKFWNN